MLFFLIMMNYKVKRAAAQQRTNHAEVGSSSRQAGQSERVN